MSEPTSVQDVEKIEQLSMPLNQQLSREVAEAIQIIK